VVHLGQFLLAKRRMHRAMAWSTQPGDGVMHLAFFVLSLGPFLSVSAAWDQVMPSQFKARSAAEFAGSEWRGRLGHPLAIGHEL
jgi:hypothetical protein